MTTSLISNNHLSEFRKAFELATNTINIISPFITSMGVKLLIEVLNKKKLKSIILTKFCDDDFIARANTLSGLKKLIEAGVCIYAIKKLHTKLYIIDKSVAILGSANFTHGGLKDNCELSAKITNDDNLINELNAYFDKLYLDGKKYPITLELIEKKEKELDTRIKENKNKPKGNEYGAEIIADDQYKNLNGILKFEYTTDERHPSDEIYKPRKHDDFYLTCSPKSKKPRMLTKDKLLFMTIMSYDINGKECPMIVGTARTYGFNENNCADSQMKDIPRIDHFSNFVKLYDIRIIDTVVKNCIPLYDIIQKFGLKTYPSTTASNPYKAYSQQSYRGVSKEARDYILQCLNEKFIHYGENNY